MKTIPPTPSTLTLFDASQFEFSTDPDAKTPPGSLQNEPVRFRGGTARAVRGDPANCDAVHARRRRAKARVAKRRYEADSDGYERLVQTRRALQLVGD